MSVGIKKRIKRRLKKPEKVDKNKGQGVNVIVSESEVNKDGQSGSGGTIEGWLKIQTESCNGQGGNESISIFKDFRNSS